MVKEAIYQEVPIWSTVCLQLAKASLADVIPNHLDWYLSDVIVKVEAIVLGVSYSLAESTSDLFAAFGWNVERIGETWTTGIDQPKLSDHGPVVKTVSTQGAIDVFEACVIVIQGSHRKWFGLLTTNDAAHLAMFRPIAKIRAY